MLPLLISCPKGLSHLLADELTELGLTPQRTDIQGVFLEASLLELYRIALWSRLAGRIHLILLEVSFQTLEALYQACLNYPWETLFSVHATLSIHFHGTHPLIRNTLFGAQFIKDAIVDYFYATEGIRPSIARQKPDILLHAHLRKNKITLSLDVIGYSLHQRGYRHDHGIAPLKEHLAAALLRRSGWHQRCQTQEAFQDLCCGSGTLVIEAAMMAAHLAPGLLRTDQSLKHWKGHDESLWLQLRHEAEKETRIPLGRLEGSDHDNHLIQQAKINAKKAGVDAWITWKTLAFEHAKPIASRGLLVMNPPYGVRMGEEERLIPTYRTLGRVLHSAFQGWHAAILTSSVDLAKAVGLRSHQSHVFYQGAMPCKLYQFNLTHDNLFLEEKRPLKRSEGAMMFLNRLNKNLQHLTKWAKRQNISCYRIYDADLPEYAFAIDYYDGYIVLQEYAPKSTVDPQKAMRRRLEVHMIVKERFHLTDSQLILKTRERKKGLSQYERLETQAQRLVVSEGQAKFYVNLTDYLDTGLFLDHRPLRLTFYNILKPGLRFLNCFCYTATASIHAALAGAKTTNVDLSKTYLQWAKDNFALNQLNPQAHDFIHDDCTTWLAQTQETFDVIFLDPPSFSNSKRMTNTLDIQRDHETLIQHAIARLKPKGKLYFSTNLKHFQLSSRYITQATDITHSTIDLDFKRHAQIHHVFLIQSSIT